MPLSPSKKLPRFLCLSVAKPDLSLLSVFTPRVMRWDEKTWLMDLSACDNYWQMRAQALGIEVESLFNRILNQIYPREGSSFKAALAHHPWQAVLMASYMEERGLKGLLNIDSQFGQTAYEQITWPLWFECSTTLSQHLLNAKTPRFNLARFRQRKKQLQSAIARLRFYRLTQLKDVSELSMQRRFGATLSLLWEWTILAGKNLDLDGFPWLSWHPSEKPKVTTHLDYPLWQWEAMEPFFREDLDKLCQQNIWSAEERVLKLKWSLTLDDLSISEVTINFRHPHSLHKEKSQHKTALAQANFAFTEVFAKNLTTENVDILTTIIGWTLSVDERISVAKVAQDLFADNLSEEEVTELITLENQLPVSLAQFDMRKDWLPEDSFIKITNADKPANLEQNSKSWLELARVRPMFIFDKPQPFFPTRSEMEAKLFLERTNAKWWSEKPQPKPLYRDYYRYIDKSQHAKWIFQDQLGKWYLHGIFG